MSDRLDINRFLNDMRSIKSQTQAFGNTREISGDNRFSPQSGVGQVNGPTFGTVFSQAIDKVNGLQQNWSSIAQAYVKGDPSVDITDVMIASQKSSVAFTAMTQVRNKLVEAYKDVMNMPL